MLCPTSAVYAPSDLKPDSPTLVAADVELVRLNTIEKSKTSITGCMGQEKLKHCLVTRELFDICAPDSFVSGQFPPFTVVLRPLTRL